MQNNSLLWFVKQLSKVIIAKTWNRISVWEYLLVTSFFWFITGIFLSISEFLYTLPSYIIVWQIISTIWILIRFFVLVYYWIKRLHDLWKNGWNILFLLIPFVNIYRAIVISFEKWNKWENKYWHDPLIHQPESNKNYRILFFLMLIITMVINYLISLLSK